MASLLTKIFGSRNDRLIKQYRRKVAAINKLEPEMKALSDEQLKAKTAEFRQRLADGASLDSLLPEAFAVVREASFRVLGMRHFDVQLIGGMVLNDGKIAEMRTGEGKTLTATLAVYLNALPGKGAHVVTVNDYLASRDAAWMGKVYNFLGMSVERFFPISRTIRSRPLTLPILPTVRIMNSALTTSATIWSTRPAHAAREVCSSRSWTKLTPF